MRRISIALAGSFLFGCGSSGSDASVSDATTNDASTEVATDAPLDIATDGADTIVDAPTKCLVSSGKTSPTKAALQVTAGAPTHVVRTAIGGTYWLMSKYTTQKAGELLKGPFGVIFKTDSHAFGLRWDTRAQDPRDDTYSYFTHDPTDPTQMPSTIDDEMAAAEAGGWTVMVSLAMPETTSAAPPKGEGYGYDWETDAYWANLVQYLTGKADADWATKVAALSPSADAPDSLDAKNAGFNWANLRAHRGHADPYKVYAFTVGMEPYYADGLKSAAEYVSRYATRAAAVKKVAPDAKLAAFLFQNGNDDWEKTLMTGVDDKLVDVLLLRDSYVGFGNPRATNAGFFLGAFNASYAAPGTGFDWNADGTLTLYDGLHVPAVVNFFPFQAQQDVDRFWPKRADLKQNLAWSEWGYDITSPPGSFDDLGTAIERAGHFADSMANDVAFDVDFVLAGEDGYDYGWMARKKGSRDMELTPTFHAGSMLASLVGGTFVPSTLSGPTYDVTPTTGYPELRIRTLDAWVVDRGGVRELFVVNRSTTDTIELDLPGMSDRCVGGWTQLGGGGLTDTASNLTKDDAVVPETRTDGALVFEPLSISLVTMIAKP